MKKLTVAVLAALILAFSFTASASKNDGGDEAGGDQVKNPWQNVPEGTCTVWSPEGLTAEVCVDDPDGISGQDYLCTFDTSCPDGLETED